ncbi:MAG: flippase-like domain-containing protein [Bacteroides sp.]|nr:flippase-like domain-containing protein [Bacteroides sp.]MBD5262852.1 flippase-like domain-containing protein [Bacteroides sp.]
MNTEKDTDSKTKPDDVHAGKTKDIIEKILKTVLPIGISAAMILWMAHKLDFHRIWGIISHDCDYWWLLLVMVLTMLSYSIRGIRWGYQLRAAGIPRMSVAAESVSIFSAYAINLLVPYLGEAWRCVYVVRKENAKLSTVVGTDLADRSSDFVMIMLLLGLSLIVAHPALTHFFDQYQFGRDIDSITSKWELWAAIAGAIGIFILCDLKYKDSKFFKGLNLSIARMWQGFKVIFTMEGRWTYLFLTIAIWVCYFLKIYLVFFAFPFTRELLTHPGYAFGLLPGLVAFVFGSFSMAIPSNGGLGPWNIAVMYALMLYGIGHTDAAAFSIVAWATQTFMTILLGIYSMIYIAATRKKGRKTADMPNNI